MQTDATSPTPRDLAVLDSVIATIVRSGRLTPEDGEDFRQTIYLRLAERGGDLFRRFDGRSSLRTYLFVVVNRMLLDWRNHTYGKWRPSVAARRHGAVAISLDRLINRDGYSVEQAIEQVQCLQPGVDAGRLRHLAATLPERRTRHIVATELSEQTTTGFADPVEAQQRTLEVRLHRAALARALEGLDTGDRRLIWLRYYRRLTVPAVAAQLQTEPQILYRRFNRIMRVLRQRLMERGVTGAIAIEG